MQCVSCGFENIPGMQRCVRCQSALELGSVVVVPPRASRWRTGSRLRRLWNPIWPAITGLFQALPKWRPASLAMYHVPWGAVALSIVPGLGHLRYGNKRTDWMLLAGWLICLLGMLLTLGINAQWWFLGGAVSIHSTAMLAFMGTILGEKGLMGRFVLGLGLFLGLYFLVYRPIGSLGGQLYVPFPVPDVLANEVIFKGDALLYEGPWKRSATFHRGDLVLYQIEATHLEQGYVAVSGFGLDRIVGVPGDHVSWRGGKLLVNGQPPAAGQQPLRDASKIDDFEVDVETGRYVILPSALDLRMHGNVRTGALMARLSHVAADDILGRVVLRMHPWSRFGRIP